MYQMHIYCFEKLADLPFPHTHQQEFNICGQYQIRMFTEHYKWVFICPIDVCLQIQPQ